MGDAPAYAFPPPLDLDRPEVAAAVDELSLWSARFGTLLLDELPLEGRRRVLDLGCGCGFPALELAHLLGRGARLVGLDPWAAGLARAAAKARVHGTANLLLVRGDGAALPLADGAVDLVVSNLGVNNFADPGRVLAECRRVLRPDGRLALTTNPRGHFRELYAALRAVCRDIGHEGALAAIDADEAHRPTRTRLEALLAGAGLEPVRAVRRRFAMCPASGSAFLSHPLVRIGFLDAWRRAVGPEREGAVFARLGAELDRSAASGAGELRLTVPMLYIEARRPA